MPETRLPLLSLLDPSNRMTDEQLQQNIQLGYERFRILIIGDANVGKKTIMQKVYKAGGFEPAVRDEMENQVCDMLSARC